MCTRPDRGRDLGSHAARSAILFDDDQHYCKEEVSTQDYLVTFEQVVHASSDEEATEMAKEQVANRRNEPVSVEVMT